VRDLLRTRNFLLIWGGQGISELGSWINFVGLNAWLFHLYKSSLLLGFFLAARVLTALLFGPLGGILADRYDRRIVMILCNALRGVIVLGYLLTADLTVFFLLGIALSSLDKIFDAAHGALFPSIVPKESLVRANSLRRMLSSLTAIAGPMIGGVVITVWGYRAVFVIDALSFALSVGSLLMMETAGERRAARERFSIIDEMRQAWAFFRGRSLLIMFTVIRFADGFASGAYNTALPLAARNFPMKGGGFYGPLLSSWGIGCFCGALMAGAAGKQVRSRGRLFLFATALMACGMGVTFWQDSPWAALFAIFLGGLGDGVSGVLFVSVLMEESPGVLRGKVYGTVNALLFGFIALGMFVSGLALERASCASVTAAASFFIILATTAAMPYAGKTLLQSEKEA
jgi:MFS family permease